MRVAAAFVVGAVLILASPAIAEKPSFTGGTLLQMCQLHDGSAFDTICQAYVSGYFAGLSAGSVLSRTQTKICVPVTLGPGDVRPVIEAHLGAHPEWGNRDAATLVASALFISYPCKPGQQPN